MNIGRSGKALARRLDKYSSVDYKTRVIGKLFSKLKGKIGDNTSSTNISSS